MNKAPDKTAPTPDPTSPTAVLEKGTHEPVDTSLYLRKGLASLERSSAHDTKEAKEAQRKILIEALQDPSGEGHAILGQELLIPVRTMLKYESWTRKMLVLKDLKQGELNRPRKCRNNSAFYIGEGGEVCETSKNSMFVFPMCVKTTVFPQFALEDLFAGKVVDLLDRIQDTSRQELELEENRRTLNLFEACVAETNQVQATAKKNFSSETLRQSMRMLEDKGHLVHTIAINRSNLSPFLTNCIDGFEPIADQALNLAGYVGTFDGANVIVQASNGVEESVRPDTMWLATTPENLGSLAARVDFFSEPYSLLPHGRTVKGWAWIGLFEQCIWNPIGVAKVLLH